MCQWNIAHHFITSSDKYCDRAGIGTFLDDKHLVPGRPKRNFSDEACLSQFCRGQVFETGNNSTMGGYCDELVTGEEMIANPVEIRYLNFRSTDPTYGRQIILHQQMVRLVIEAPLTDDQICAGIFHPLDHVRKFLFLIFSELLVLVNAGDVQFMLRLWARRFERTCEDGEFRILNKVGHLRVRHVFVDENAFDQRSVREGTSDFAIDLNEVEGNVAPLQICHSQHSVDGYLCELFKFLGDTRNIQTT